MKAEGLKNKNILITGVAGFIGSFLCKRLLRENFKVVGIDNMNNYYDTSIKEKRIDELKEYNNFSFFKTDLSNINLLNNIFCNTKFDLVVHLGAQAGVR